MKEILLCKYGEIILKGANRRYFEDMLCKTIRFRGKHFGKFTVTRSQSTIVIEPRDDAADMDGMFETTLKIFGIVGVSRCAVCEKDMDAIRRTAREYLPPFLGGKRTFKVEAKRSDKRFPLTSPEIAREIGGEVLSVVPRLKVDVREPEVTVNVEIREFGAYLHAGQFKGAGGIPVGTSGKALLLLSGGIDSPVAGYMMAKRGVQLEAVHFESFPYASERAREKVFELAGQVAQYAGSVNLHVVSLTHIQEELVKNCEEDYFTLILRRYMMAIADRIAAESGCGALITGESLGQVASQTMPAIGASGWIRKRSFRSRAESERLKRPSNLTRIAARFLPRGIPKPNPPSRAFWNSRTACRSRRWWKKRSPAKRWSASAPNFEGSFHFER